jgi:hypothetical protein
MCSKHTIILLFYKQRKFYFKIYNLFDAGFSKAEVPPGFSLNKRYKGHLTICEFLPV